MQMRSFWAIAAMICSIVLYSCNKNNGPAPASIFSFKLGTDFYHASTPAAYLTDTIYNGKKTLVIDGVTNNFGQHMELMITFPDSVHAGIYTSGVEMSLMDIQQRQTGYMGNNIKVIVTDINSKHAEGIFSGALINGDIEKPLTDGTFKVQIY